jgi:competence protein ComFC
MNIRSWFSANAVVCLVCGRDNKPAGAEIPIPVRNPLPRRILSSLCSPCLSSIPWIVHPVCRICGRFERCDDCVRRKERHFAMSRCSVRYDSLMKDWLALYKYRGNEELESVMAAMLAFAFERLCGEFPEVSTRTKPISRFPVITSVPLAAERLADRGFNQAERVAIRLSQWYRASYQPMLVRLRHTEKQSLKSRRSRVVDMRGNFSLASNNLSDIPSEPINLLYPDVPARIILVDDIYTTGSTLDECARVLREGGGDRRNPPVVYGLLWARS